MSEQFKKCHYHGCGFTSAKDETEWNAGHMMMLHLALASRDIAIEENVRLRNILKQLDEWHESDDENMLPDWWREVRRTSLFLKESDV